ncbi:MAG: 5-oxoprolinase [Dactylosporangium sp.]|nr:hydantoinase B/oxoprolinase family protein [Dactylosporangium sp.]NNJ60956.1 5-oxoprolinase [Dactylosporangium sp.]
MGGGWEFWIDRGGTFTDVVARRPDGAILSHKLLSEDPQRYPDAAVAGIRALLGVPDDQPLPAEQIDVVKMGTTVATNALLQRTGEPTVLVITSGFADALRIAYQNRPRIFDRRIVLPEPLHSRVIEARERLGADGAVITPLDERQLRADLRAAYDAGSRAVAVVLLHAHRYPVHEARAGTIAREIGFPQVSVSHRVSPLVRLVSRGDTTVVDAYLSPVLHRYVRRVRDQLRGVRLMFMQSSGGLADAANLRGKDAVLSGPAGGVVGMARTALAAGFDRVIGFDMGGTSTDVAHFAGEYEREFETQVAGVRMRTAMMSIHTVAAGGGSILGFDGGRYRVGPRSAGAWPGPAAYRRGGALTVTDANVLLGRIQPHFFPSVFGEHGGQPLDAAVVADRFAALAGEVAAATGTPTSPEAVAAGFLEIAVANMANAIKKISVQRGYDVTGYVLATFGGAGGQHACAVADALGMTRILIHPLAGVLSAYGIGLADLTAIREHPVEAVLGADLMPRLADLAASLEAEARRELVAGGVEPARIGAVHRVHLRYAGTDTPIEVRLGPLADLVAAFEAGYRRRFAFLLPEKPVVVEAIVVEATAATVTGGPGDHAVSEPGRPPARGHRPDPDPAAAPVPVRVFVEDTWREVDCHRRRSLGPGSRVDGPAIIAEANATTVVEPGWRASVNDLGYLLLTRVGPRPARRSAGTAADPVLLEVFNNLFMSVAEQMGVRLQSTAHSVNIKERLDFSCAVFDATGNLIANAPHIPVHLGSMGESIATVISRNAGRIGPGDVYALNDPYHGGTHLPDITVVTPVFDGAGAEILFYVASRGHHAEIGGITPGSMPAFSTRVDEEGVLIDNWRLVRGGVLREAATLDLLRSAAHPSRNPADNLADLRAQLAANEKGVQELRAMVDHFGLDVVRAYLGHVQDNAEEALRRVIPALRDSRYVYRLDSGAVITVELRVDAEARSVEVDFTGTAAQSPTNANAPTSVAMAAVLYVFRTLVDGDIPLNAGCLRPIRVVVPSRSLLSPEYPAAVVAGNVETSQAIVGALYGALGGLAEGSGTMNNVTFGNERHQYYETVASGSGAGDGFAGTAVVQTHMTNSRLTDPEVLEWRYPVRVESYEIRRGSGGAGRWPGGDGGRRRIRFLEPMTVTTLCGHRRVPPYGAAGGQPGALGGHWVERADGSVRPLHGCDAVTVAPGDVFVIETPGGGGYGPASERRSR